MTEPLRIDWLNALPMAVLVVRDARVLLANCAAGDLFGCSSGELTGAHFDDLLVGAADAARLTTPAGAVIPVTYTDAEVDHDGRPARLITVLRREPSRIFREAIEAGIDTFLLVQVEHDSAGGIHDFLVVDANDHAATRAGLSSQQLIGHHARDLLTEASLKRLIEQTGAMFASGKPAYGEIHLTDTLVKDGWYEVQLIPLEGEQFAVFLRDIIARKESEALVQTLAHEVEQQARLLDEMLSATPDTFILFDREGHYLYVNRVGLESAGMTVDQVSGKTWREMGFPEEVGLRFEQRLAQVFSTGESMTYEEQFPTLLGLRDFVTTLTPIHDSDGSVMFMLNTIHDITERKEAEREQQKLSAELEQQTRIFDEVLSTTPDSFLMIDRGGKFLYASPSALRSVSLTSSQVIGKTWTELGFPEEAGKHADALIAKVLETGEPSVMENAFPTVTGLRRFESIYSPLHDKAGEVVAVVITNHDVTERIQIEEQLRENQRLLTSIYETALVGIAVIDEQGHYVQVNQTLCDIYGYSAAELVGSHFSMMYPPESLARGRDAHDRLIGGEGAQVRTEWTLRRKGGQLIEVSAYDNLLVRENGERFRVVAIIDITAQKQAQRALEESEQRLTSILNSMQDVVWSVRADSGEWIYANPAIESL
ncbi:MAG: PAS domain S-box protein, partial [Anaerolineae bacterium]|nr:PAS domain S-box protein [Anaerolineae bacterium]